MQVEIDESKFVRRKYHRGRKAKKLKCLNEWREDMKESGFDKVDDRKAERLLLAVREHIKP